MTAPKAKPICSACQRGRMLSHGERCSLCGWLCKWRKAPGVALRENR